MVSSNLLTLTIMKETGIHFTKLYQPPLFFVISYFNYTHCTITIHMLKSFAHICMKTFCFSRNEFFNRLYLEIREFRYHLFPNIQISLLHGLFLTQAFVIIHYATKVAFCVNPLLCKQHYQLYPDPIILQSFSICHPIYNFFDLV